MIEFPGLEKLWAALPEARIAGGAVRDSLAGRAVADIDLAAPFPPADIIARLAAAGIKTIPTGLAHGTVTAFVAGRGFEITSLRRDVETDGRHALVAFTDDWVEDAARRDFTINAMFLDRAGQLYDYFGGQDDLRAGRLRFVGDARTRITEDFLRILRFFRFYARYAAGPPDAAAMTAITDLRNGILGLSAERLWSELKNILSAIDPGPAIGLMQSTFVLDLLIPEGTSPERLNTLIAQGAPPDALLRTAALLNGDATAFAARLKLSSEERAALTALKIPTTLNPNSTPAELRRALADTDTATLIAQTWLAQTSSSDWHDLRARIAATPTPIFPLQGRDLTALGLPPGPQIGEILRTVRTWWLSTGCTAPEPACLAKALAAITDPKPSG
jgi:poly(A) polymerase/tRNA nucleotidyltransferase (CCA-adding enzyme)